MSAGDGWKDCLVGFLVGAVVGGTAALLLTPKTGRENRQAVVRKARQLGVKTYGACFDPQVWNDWATAEEAENLVNNIRLIRSAGL